MTQLTLAFDDFPGVVAKKAPAWSFSAPPGTDPKVGNCGIVACALITGNPIAEVHADILAAAEAAGYRKVARHWNALKRGGTNKALTDAYLKACGVKITGAPVLGQTVKTACRMLNPAKLYMVHMTRHVAMLHGGELLDQSEKKPVEAHWTANKRVTRIVEVTPKQ